MVAARFDDLVAGTAMEFADPADVLVAWQPSDVMTVLDRVDRSGSWAFGYLAYEAAAAFGLPVAQPTPGLPLAWFVLCPQPVVSWPSTTPPDPGRTRATWLPDWTDADYDASIETVRGHIAAGDTYQVNLTSRLRAHGVDARALYASMLARQRTAFAAYLDLGGHVIASASPELFFRWDGQRIELRPMKGTARRGATPAEDEALRAGLLASEKERAENVIVTDLLRNDLGRIATTGSVRVDRLCEAERYQTVWQLTSSLSGGYAGGLADIFRALFPSGSVTGAPKHRTMELVRSLEASPRGVYCGAIGWVAPPGAPVRAQFSVAIRTAVVTGGEAVYGVGGGITWGSVAAAERAELAAKSSILQDEVRLLETLAYLPGAGFRNLAGHLARLARSAAELGFALDPAAVRASVSTVAGTVPCRVRLTLTRAGGVSVTTAPLPPSGPVRLALDDRPTSSPVHKTTDRGLYEAALARHPSADDVVLVNAAGEATETTIANLCVRLDGRWWTPALSGGLLPGVERARLLAAGVLTERVIPVAELTRAEAVAVVSSLRGWRQATLLR